MNFPHQKPAGSTLAAGIWSAAAVVLLSLASGRALSQSAGDSPAADEPAGRAESVDLAAPVAIDMSLDETGGATRADATVVAEPAPSPTREASAADDGERVAADSSGQDDAVELAVAEPSAPADTDAGDAADAEEPAEKPSRVAENVDLSQPVEPEALAEGDPGEDVTLPFTPPDLPRSYTNEQPSLYLLGTEIPASTSTRLAWTPEQSFDGIAVPTPVLVVNGATRGPVVCLTAAIHGDELNGIEVVRRVMYDLEPDQLAGAVIGVPIVNLQGFRRGTRYLPDRRDLNRFFPGNPEGSLASRIAHSFFTEIIERCEALVDLHTGSFHRTNLPQIRADLRNADVVHLTRGFGSTVVLHSRGSEGTLRRAATDHGIPSVTLEAGEPARLQQDAVEHGTKGVMTLLNELDMYRQVTFWGSRERVYYRSTWVRADRGGVLFSVVELGEQVAEGQVLGTITDPITNVQSTLRASSPGRVLGMALNQFVMPGFAAFRIGIEAPGRDAPPPSQSIDGEPSTHTAGTAADDASLLDESETGDVEADEADDTTASDEELENSD